MKNFFLKLNMWWGRFIDLFNAVVIFVYTVIAIVALLAVAGWAHEQQIRRNARIYKEVLNEQSK